MNYLLSLVAVNLFIYCDKHHNMNHKSPKPSAHRISYIAFLILSLCLTACSNQSEKDLLQRFKTVKECTHETIVMNDDSFFSSVFQIYVENDRLLAYDYDKKFLFSLTDLKEKTMLAKFIGVGQGPNEIPGMITAVNYLYNGNFCFFSPNTRKMYFVNYLNSYLFEKTLPFDTEKMMLNVIPVGSNYVALGWFNEGRYLLLDKDGKEMSCFLDYPHFEGDEQFTNAHKAMAFQGKLIGQPDSKRFFFAASNSHIFEIMEVVDNKGISKVFEYQGELGQFVPEGDGQNMEAAAIRKESRSAFVGANCTQKYIYLLYSGNVIADEMKNGISGSGKTVFAFDWDGNPVKKLQLDTYVKCIAVTADDQTMYAITNVDDVSLLRFDL